MKICKTESKGTADLADMCVVGDSPLPTSLGHFEETLSPEGCHGKQFEN